MKLIFSDCFNNTFHLVKPQILIRTMCPTPFARPNASPYHRLLVYVYGMYNLNCNGPINARFVAESKISAVLSCIRLNLFILI